MARPIWSGAVNFGLVSVPVGLYSATRDHTVHFHQIERGTSDRVRNRRVNERTNKEVELDDVVKGYAVGDDEYVTIEPDELEAVAPGRSRTLEIETFVDLADIDPVYFQKSYWLAPGKDSDPKPYALLVEAMDKTNQAGIGTFVMRGKEYLAAIRADNGVLALETLYFADEVLDPAEQLPAVPQAQSAKGKQLDMAVSLVESMSGRWDPADYRDHYTDRVKGLLEDKSKGREMQAEPEPAGPTNVTDLVEVLRQSIEQAQSSSKSSKSSKTSQSLKSSRSSKGRGGRKGQPDLGELTKTELDEMARELRIAGRSKMKRAELEKAITEAGKSVARRKAS